MTITSSNTHKRMLPIETLAKARQTQFTVYCQTTAVPSLYAGGWLFQTQQYV